MPQMNAYLGFDGDCHDAMTFYQRCLGGTLELQTVGQSAIAEQMPPETHGRVIHSSLSTDGFVLMASDMPATALSGRGGGVSLMLSCSSPTEIERLFEGLGEGGTVTQPLMQSFWGSTFGHLTDRYGVAWMFDYTPVPVPA